MSDSPRTDAIFASPNRPSPAQLKPIMQQLERELAAALARIQGRDYELSKATILTWIPVSDASPEDDQDVLVIAGGSVRIAHRWHDDLGEGSWRWSNGSNRRMDGVTHWAMWPTAPKL